MKQAHRDTCRCWNCFAQDNFTALSLMVLVLITLGFTFYFLLAGGLEKKDVFTFMTGFLDGTFSAFTLALKGSPTEKPHVPLSEDSTVIAIPPTEQADPKEPKKPNLVEF